MADFSKITERIFTGAAINTEEDVQALVDAGVTHIIDCRDDFDDAPLLTSHPSLTYLWNGTPDDGTLKPDEWFAKSFSFGMIALVSPKARIYAHCAAGVNRGPSTAYMLLRAGSGITPSEAETTIRLSRPQVELLYARQADDWLSRIIF